MQVEHRLLVKSCHLLGLELKLSAFQGHGKTDGGCWVLLAIFQGWHSVVVFLLLRCRFYVDSVKFSSVFVRQSHAPLGLSQLAAAS